MNQCHQCMQTGLRGIAIIYKIQGVQSGSLGTVENPHRLIISMVIVPQRYSGYTMSDLRIDRIQVSSSLTTSVPEPVYADETCEGATETIEPSPEVQSWFDNAQAIIDQLVSWWVGWWPRLHMSLSFVTSAGGVAILHFSIDLLGDLRAEETDFDSPVFDMFSEDDRNLWSQSVSQQASQPGPIEDNFRTLTTGAIIIIGQACTLLAGAYALPGGGLAAVAVLLGIALTTWTVWLSSLMMAHSLGLISTGFAIAMIGAFGLAVIGSEAIFAYIVKSAFWTTILLLFSKIAFKGLTIATWFIWTIFGALVQICMFAYSYNIFWELMEYSMLNYLDEVAT